MDRRRFLSRSIAGLSVVAVAGCGDDTTPAPAVPPPEAPVPPPVLVVYPTPTFITCDPGFTDYRPAVDASGKKFIFERTVYPNPNDAATTLLYLVDTTAGGAGCFTATPFLTVPTTPPAQYPTMQTRPDWTWVGTQEVAFSGATSVKGTNEVHIVAGTGRTPRVVPLTVARIYPIWTSTAAQLIVYDDNNSAQSAPPVTQLIDPSTGSPAVTNLNGNDANGKALYGGFASPQPGTATRIAFAGQPAIAGWGGVTTPGYNQDNNYVYLNAAQSGGYSSAPLEPGANIATFDPKYQGRAPYWSPDGNYIVFESSRAGGYALFLAKVADVMKGAAPVQLTDSTYWAQHAKFLPGGTQLVYTCLQKPSTTMTGPRGIAVIDIAAYL